MPFCPFYVEVEQYSVLSYPLNEIHQLINVNNCCVRNIMYKKQIFDLSYLVQKKFERDLEIFLKVRETNEMNIKIYLIMREII